MHDSRSSRGVHNNWGIHQRPSQPFANRDKIARALEPKGSMALLAHLPLRVLNRATKKGTD